MGKRCSSRLFFSAAILIGMTAICGGCDSDSVFPSEIDWTIIDDCDDGLGIQVRFFDLTDGAVWPSDSEVYVVPSDGEETFFLDCSRDNIICFGATTDPATGGGWGRLIDGSRSCTDCCVDCGDVVLVKDTLGGP